MNKPFKNKLFQFNAKTSPTTIPMTSWLLGALALGSLAITSVGFLGCARSDRQQPIVTELSVQSLDEVPAAAHRIAEFKLRRELHSRFHQRVTPGSADHSSPGEWAATDPKEAGSTAAPTPPPPIAAEVTMLKKEILSRTFLYGADLQYSTIGEEDGWALQAMAIGHTPAQFVLFADRLQLIADLSYRFESDINRPGQLIHEFPIIRQDADSVTISIRKASPALNSIMGGGAFRTTWVRSAEFIEKGNYLLFETSVESSDGSVVEFMESLFPRETLVPPGTKPVLADPELEPLAERFLFIANSSPWLDFPDGRKKTWVASRFPVGASGGTIEWYVTTNAPARYLPAIRSGIEGWNRYSQKMWGRNFVQFKGYLPAGIKLGDPRFNVVNWDSVPSAGAAYESQASDPISGLQSHSLIYLPYAWAKIGEEFWEDAASTQDDADSAGDEKSLASFQKLINRASFIGQKINLNCLHDIAHAMPLEMRKTPELFGQELLRQVLFHEVGHALGLGHNFKGSLSYDPHNPKSLFATTVMDYNQYQLEDGSFSSPTSSDGALLEYDRQAISALYNEGRDITPQDPVLPACSDDDADSSQGGVDPFCLRYDAGQDPTQHLIDTLKLTQDPTATLGRTKSLSTALRQATQSLGDPASATSEAEVMNRVSSLSRQLNGTAAYYYSSGSQSVSYMMLANLRSLYVFRPEVLPASIDEIALRQRVTTSLQHVLNLTSLDRSTHLTFNQIASELGLWLSATPWFSSLAAEQKSAASAQAIETLNGLIKRIEQRTLPRVRRAVLASLVRDPEAPFFFIGDQQPALDFERMSLELLESALTQPLPNGGTRSTEERLAAARSLRTFADTLEGEATLARAISRTKADLSRARNAAEREALRRLLKALQP